MSGEAAVESPPRPSLPSSVQNTHRSTPERRNRREGRETRLCIVNNGQLIKVINS